MTKNEILEELRKNDIMAEYRGKRDGLIRIQVCYKDYFESCVGFDMYSKITTMEDMIDYIKSQATK